MLPYAGRSLPVHVIAVVTRADDEIRKLESTRSQIESGRAAMTAYFQQRQSQTDVFRGRIREIEIIEQLNAEIQESEVTIESSRQAFVDSVNSYFSQGDILREEMNSYMDGATVALALAAANSGDLQADLMTIEATLEEQVQLRS